MGRTPDKKGKSKREREYKQSAAANRPQVSDAIRKILFPGILQPGSFTGGAHICFPGPSSADGLRSYINAAMGLYFIGDPGGCWL